MDKKLGTNSGIDISDYYEPKYSGEVEINKTLDTPEETITYEDLDNQITHKLKDAQDSGESED